MAVLGIQNCDLEGFGRYARLLTQWEVGLEVVRAHSGQPLPPSSGFDALLVGGTPISARDLAQHDFLRGESRYLAHAVAGGMPCLGICCGAQLLAQVLGAEVRRCERMEIGPCEVRLTDAGTHDDVLAGFPRKFPVFQWHGDVFELPEHARLLVEGEICRNQMFRVGSVLGVLFHLEVASGEVAAWADEYAHELALVGKSKAAVVSECEASESAMADLAERLLRNFLRSMAQLQLPL
ncbi:MAG: GMP synthase [Gemmatimonadales bacterium]|nr:GMP synthase [Gemmatimonadales bacterium]